MKIQVYRLTLLGSVLSWFLLGLHAPAVHQMTHHGRVLPVSVIAAMFVLGTLGLAALWLLLRVRPSGERSSEIPAA